MKEIFASRSFCIKIMEQGLNQGDRGKGISDTFWIYKEFGEKLRTSHPSQWVRWSASPSLRACNIRIKLLKKNGNSDALCILWLTLISIKRSPVFHQKNWGNAFWINRIESNRIKERHSWHRGCFLCIWIAHARLVVNRKMTLCCFCLPVHRRFCLHNRVDESSLN